MTSFTFRSAVFCLVGFSTFSCLAQTGPSKYIQYQDIEGKCFGLLYTPCIGETSQCTELKGFPMGDTGKKPTTLLYYASGSPVEIECPADKVFDPGGCDPADGPCLTLPDKDVTVFQFDFADRCKAPDLTKFKLKRGDYYAVWIRNLNLNLYQVNLAASDTTIAKAITFPSFDMVSVTGIKDLLATVSTAVSSAPGGAVSLINPPPSAIPDRVKYRLTEETNRLKGHTVTLEQIAARIVSVNDDVALYKLRFSAEFPCQYSSVAGSDGLSQLNDIETRMKAIRTDLIKLKDLTIEGDKAFKQFCDSVQIDTHFEEKPSLGKQRDSLFVASTKLKAALDAQLKPFSLEKIAAKSIALGLVRSNGTLGYRSLPMQYNGGEGKIELEILPIDTTLNLSRYAPPPYYFPVSSRSYWGVSTSFYATRLYDEAISTGVDPSDSSRFALFPEVTNKGEFGAALKFVFGTIVADNGLADWGLHLTIGPGVNISERIRPRLLTGGGVSYGRKNRVVLDIGWITGYVARRSNAYQNDGGYLQAPENTTIDRLDGSGFISLGYMLEL